MNKYHNRRVPADPMTWTIGDSGGRPLFKRHRQDESDYESADGNVERENLSNTGESADEDDDRGGGVSSWFGGLQTRPSTPAVKAGQKVIFDSYESAWSAVLGTVQAKTFKVLKILVLLFVKFKVFAMMKFWFIVKLLVLAKIVKFVLLPFVINTIAGYANAQTLVPALNPACPGLLVGPPGPPGPPSENTVSAYNMTSASEQSSASSSLYRNGSTSMSAAVAHNRFMDLDTFGTAFVPKLTRFVSVVQSAQCVQRMACTEAGSKSPKSEFVWINE